MASLTSSQLLNALAQVGLIPTPAALAWLERRGDLPGLLGLIEQRWDQRKVFCAVEDLEELWEDTTEPGRTREDVLAPSKAISRLAPPLEVLDDVGEAPASGTQVEDFAALFQDRYKSLAQLLRRRAMMREVTEIGRLDNLQDRGEVRLIAMVSDIARTEKGLRVTLEDPSGTVVAANYDDPAIKETKLLPDEVVGVVAQRRRGTQLILKEVHFPSLERKAPPSMDTPAITAAFISDVHVGSNTFLEKAWENFLAWVRQENGQDLELELARRLGYLVLNGDVVDGIDAYPDQEQDLAITDLQEQYRLLGEHLASLPSQLQIIITPGNHDACRLMEPQPTLGADIRRHFSPNVRFLSNPSAFELAGVEVLAYHGKSLDDLVSHLPDVTYDNCLAGMRAMLERRHLAPVYGEKTPMVPMARDTHVIRRVPHIFVTGHVHSMGVERHKGVLMVNPGTWQSQTDYQRMMNFSPDPGKAVVVELDSLQHSVLDFNPAA